MSVDGKGQPSGEFSKDASRKLLDFEDMREMLRRNPLTRIGDYILQQHLFSLDGYGNCPALLHPLANPFEHCRDIGRLYLEREFARYRQREW